MKTLDDGELYFIISKDSELMKTTFQGFTLKQHKGLSKKSLILIEQPLHSSVNAEEILNKYPKIFYEELSDSTGTAIDIEDAIEEIDLYAAQESERVNRDLKGELVRKYQEWENQRITIGVFHDVMKKHWTCYPSSENLDEQITLIKSHLDEFKDKLASRELEIITLTAKLKIAEQAVELYNKDYYDKK